jgi:mannose-1-phosphate guanylyltransferase
MAGGVGERFWPQSRRRTPKQLLDLTGRGTMIALTVDRVSEVSRPDEIFIVTNAEQAEAIAAATQGRVDRDNIIGEPQGRNTAATIGLAASIIRRRVGDAPFMVLPADHLVGDLDRYNAAVRAAESYATDNDALITFGIKPGRAETGYGYIRMGSALDEKDGVVLCEAASFHEKPDAETAEKFYRSGAYFWNSGMFCWRPQVIMAALGTHMPELVAALAPIEDAVGTPRFDAVFNEKYPDVPAQSIDYGVMEHADNVVALKGDFYWNDVGNWESVRDMYDADQAGNVSVGEHVFIDASRNTIVSPKRLIGVLGLDDVVIVDSGDALLVCKRDRVQDVRRIVEELKRRNKKDLF